MCKWPIISNEERNMRLYSGYHIIRVREAFTEEKRPYINDEDRWICTYVGVSCLS